MSNFVDAADALRARLASGFTALPLFFANDDRTPDLKTAPNGFVYVHVHLQDERQLTLGPEGAREHRDFGELSAYVYVPRGSRIGAAEQHAQDIRALFKTTAVDGVVVTRRIIGSGENVDGPGKASRAFCVPVHIEFFSDRVE